MTNLCRKCGPDKNSNYVCVACVAQIIVDIEKRLIYKVDELEANYHLVRRRQ